jgi:hypothetical protein
MSWRDPRPLSERFDLRYVRARSWPDVWTVRLSLLASAIAGLMMLVASMGNSDPFSPGPVTGFHAMFEHDCRSCHQPDPQRSGYWLPASDAACLKCHKAAAHEPPAFHAAMAKSSPSGTDPATLMASNCVACHVEHQGREQDISRVRDRACVQCHADLTKHREKLLGKRSLTTTAELNDEPSSTVDAMVSMRGAR